MTLYNNGYPATYPQMYPVYQQTAPQSSSPGGRIWVQGESGAKSYLVAPNSTVDLWDSENPVIYQKSADASGMPCIKVLDYTVRESNRNASNFASTGADDKLSNFATKDDFRAVSEQITALRKRIDKLTKKQEEDDDE